VKKELRRGIIIYILTWLFIIGFFVLAVMYNGGTFKRGLTFFTESFTNISFLFGCHIFFALVYLLFLITRYFVRTYRKKGLKLFLKRLSLRLVLPVALIFVSYKTLVYANGTENYKYDWNASVENTSGMSKGLFDEDGKHRGMSVFGWRKKSEADIEQLVANNIEWVAITPFLYQKDENTSAMNVRDTYDQWDRRDSSFIAVIGDLHSRKMKVHLKPHLWMNSGWRSNIQLNSSDEWEGWFDSYEINMLHYARMAEATGVSLFCIGTELKTSIQQKPERWKKLIEKIKTLYSGKLTYASNWDGEFDEISFWDQLDYIGIQAYFPLTQSKNPSLETIQEGWDTHIEMLEKLSQKHRKPILFTEVGYKSEASSTIKPWEWGSFWSIAFTQKSDKTQQLAYEALFQKLWHKDWFAGVYIWQWDHRSSKDNVDRNLDFSPRFKPAENVIAKWFGKL